MAKWKVTLARKQNGVKLKYTKTVEYESEREPKVDEGIMLLVNPPIWEYVEKVERVG